MSNARDDIIVALHIPADKVGAVWLLARPYIDAAMKHTKGELDSQTLLEWCSSYKGQLWVVYDTQNSKVIGAAVTSVVDYPLFSSLQVVAMGGTGFRRWSDKLYLAMLDFAKTCKCSRMEAVGRKGLGRLLAPYGFEQAYVTFIKEVAYGESDRNDKDGQ